MMSDLLIYIHLYSVYLRYGEQYFQLKVQRCAVLGMLTVEMYPFFLYFTFYCFVSHAHHILLE